MVDKRHKESIKRMHCRRLTGLLSRLLRCKPLVQDCVFSCRSTFRFSFSQMGFRSHSFPLIRIHKRMGNLHVHLLSVLDLGSHYSLDSKPLYALIAIDPSSSAETCETSQLNHLVAKRRSHVSEKTQLASGKCPTHYLRRYQASVIGKLQSRSTDALGPLPGNAQCAVRSSVRSIDTTSLWTQMPRSR